MLNRLIHLIFIYFSSVSMYINYAFDSIKIINYINVKFVGNRSLIEEPSQDLVIVQVAIINGSKQIFRTILN